MQPADKRQYAIDLLREKFAQLDRLPKRSDFESTDVCLIKQKLGAWPRALEAAGLKDPIKPSSAEKNRLKRERSRQHRKEQKKEEDNI